MKSGIKIVKANLDSGQEDLFKQCAKVYCQIWKEPPWNEDFWKPEQVIQDIKQELTMPDAQCLMAIDKSVIGFTWGYSVDKEVLRDISQGNKLDILFSNQVKVYYIDELGVSPGYRKMGIGGVLTSQLIKCAKSDGNSVIVLRTDKQAIAAKIVYTKLGFIEYPISDTRYPDRTYWVLEI